MARCHPCPLDLLDAAEQCEPGMLLRLTFDIRAASRAGIRVGLADVAADGFQAMLVLDEERES